mgnify:FL=1
MKLSDREKAAVVFGMVRAWTATKTWPKHFNVDDRSMWRDRARIAALILDGGAFNPMDHWAVMRTANDELGD